LSQEISQTKRSETELIVFAELATGIAEEEKINAENAAVIAENAVKAKQQFCQNMTKYVTECNYWIHGT
jgi:hypothetical protein